MSYFARVHVDAFRAVGIFADGGDGLDKLVDSAMAALGEDINPNAVHMEYKPTEAMNKHDWADAGAGIVGAVVVLQAH